MPLRYLPMLQIYCMLRQSKTPRVYNTAGRFIHNDKIDCYKIEKKNYRSTIILFSDHLFSIRHAVILEMQIALSFPAKDFLH